MNSVKEIPLFPLHTVLYPDGPLPLRIFEPRYLDMVSHCLRDDSSFGVLQIRDGNETGPAATWNVGTLAKISDWYQGSDGILGVTALGQQRFRVVSTSRRSDGLLCGEVRLMENDEPVPLPEEFLPLVQILDGVLDDLGRLYHHLPRRYDDAVWVGYRFAEILPFNAEQKQSCLEIENAVERLHLIRGVLQEVRGVEVV